MKMKGGSLLKTKEYFFFAKKPSSTRRRHARVMMEIHDFHTYTVILLARSLLHSNNALTKFNNEKRGKEATTSTTHLLETKGKRKINFPIMFL